MNALPKILIYLAIVAIAVGVLFKVLSIELVSMFAVYPVQPQSFLNFANSILLLSIGISVLKNKE